jgi:hypothetical protein
VADIDQVSMNIRIERTTLGSDSYTVEIRVEGTDLNNGTIRVPSSPGTPVNFSKDGDDLLIEDSFASEAALLAVLTEGDYILRVNNDTIEGTFEFDPPAVPTPAISQPSGGEVVLPGPIEVLFTACPVCNFAGDSVEAELRDEALALLDEETLTSVSTSWTPQDMGSDLLLPPNSAFVAKVTHTALDGDNFDPNDADDFAVFTGAVISSDEVDFETGFNAPSGHFCLAANHPAPPAGCETITDPLLQVLDPSGAVMTSVAGLPVNYNVTVGAGGELTGTATADLDDNGSQETGPVPIKGKLSGSEGEAGSKLSFSLANAGLDAKLKVSVTDELTIPGDQIDRLQRGSGAVGDTKIKEDVANTDSLPFEPLGWVIEFDLASGVLSNAELTLEGGRNFPLVGTNKFNFATNQSSMKLSTEQKGASVSFKGLELDDTSDPFGIVGGNCSYRVLGQSGRLELP